MQRAKTAGIEGVREGAGSPYVTEYGEQIADSNGFRSTTTVTLKRQSYLCEGSKHLKIVKCDVEVRACIPQVRPMALDSTISRAVTTVTSSGIGVGEAV